MNVSVIIGILIPFAGTSLGAAFVFFMKKQLGRSVQRALTGFAAGVMTAASVWSLLILAIEQNKSMGAFAFVPAVVGFWIGTLFLLILDKTIPHLHMFADSYLKDRYKQEHPIVESEKESRVQRLKKDLVYCDNF